MKGMIDGMIKNYIIGFLVGYVIVRLPFWVFENIFQSMFIVAVFGFWIAWSIREAEISVKDEKRRKNIRRHRNRYED